MELSGHIVDVVQGEIFTGVLTIEGGRICRIDRSSKVDEQFILPGFVDAHVHIESSMLPPSEFARLAVVHGTVGTVSDPHEIANVLGVEGIEWMIENGRTVPFKFAFGASPCVPATEFETAGARVTAEEIDQLFQRPEIRYLAEMMNFPGVLHEDPAVLEKIAVAKRHGRVIDGHAPGLRGAEAARYASFGISTDHECFTELEARDKLAAGMKILIREGSAAKNFDALIGLLSEFPDRIMFCSDDKHPNDLVVGHIDQLVRRAIRRGLDPMSVFRAASRNPVHHYGLPIGLVQVGDPADLIVTDSLEDLTVLATYIDGEMVAYDGQTNIERQDVTAINRFAVKPIAPSSLRCPALGTKLRAIEVLPGQLVTTERIVVAAVSEGQAVADPERDLLKVVVLNRYNPAPPAIGFVVNIGLREGAIASSVAHDCHNIVAVGANDEDLAAAINLVIEAEGGVAAASGALKRIVPLPIAGLMSVRDGYRVAEDYEALDHEVKRWGSTLPAPFMSLSFLALLVIPELKLSDRGLFDGRCFAFTDLWLPAET